MRGKRYERLSLAARREWALNALSELNGGGRSRARPNAILDMPLLQLKNIAPITRDKLKTALASLNLKTVRDVLWRLPREHSDRSETTPIGAAAVGEIATVKAKVARIGRATKGRVAATEASLRDASGALQVVWFGNPYIANSVGVGDEMILSGKITVFNGRKQMQNPEYEVANKSGDIRRVNTGGLTPIYPSAEATSQRLIRYAAERALNAVEGALTDWAPATLLSKTKLMDLPQAFEAAHYPQSVAQFEKARARLVFDELLFYQLGVQKARAKWRDAAKGVKIAPALFGEAVDWALGKLKIALTADQTETLNAIKSDMSDGVPMSRLLQGEVGSGKTAVAALAMLACVAAGQTAALLAPTEVLSEQHFMNLRDMLGARAVGGYGGAVAQADFGVGGRAKIRAALLNGRLRGAKRDAARALINAGEVDILIGAHALLQDDLSIQRLGLAAIDEQHRFGVHQRAHLARRAVRPHLLAMSATPIPRSLQLTTYGDMDISTMRQLPLGRRQVQTRLVTDESRRQAVYDIIRREARDGRRAFVVCPFIEESESLSDVRSAEAEYARLKREVFPDLKLGLLNGKLPLSKKQTAINAFRLGITDVLVATPVIEVGVDILDASVMLVESAERFGLAQLHQLRGRVGRGGRPGWCFLASDAAGEQAQARLEALRDIDDGFELAEKDLQLRGPGEYAGARQSGWARMRAARPSDGDLLKLARRVARSIVATDIELRRAPLLKNELRAFGELKLQDASALDEAL